MKALAWILVLGALAAGGWWWFHGRAAGGDAAEARFRTARVEKGEVVEGVQASGTVQPLLLVQVGTQVSGVISKINVDFNSRVKAGEVIALLDSRRLEAQVAGDEAAVARAKADLVRVRTTVTQSRADVDRVRALLTQAVREYDRQKALGERKLAAAADVDAALASRESLEAQAAVSEATVKQNEAQVAVAEATVAQAEAQLRGDRVSLDYATIASPIDGVVVARNVDVGQTVASSLQAPTLFLIANDLKKIQVQASVPEADTGRIHMGQTARFYVDAYGPERSFEGTVTQIRLQPTTVQNVVTYTVLVDASNPDEILLPGMTANVTFEIARSAPDGLRVSAAALRFKPAADLVDPAAAPAPGAEGGRDAGRDGGREGGRRGGGRHGGKDASPPAILYLPDGQGRLRAVRVRAGISDGALTAVTPLVDGSLAVGAEVATSVLQDGGPEVTNPFAPPRFAGGRRGGGR